MGVKKKWSELTPAQKEKIQAIMEEQEEEDIELGDDIETETTVGTKKEPGTGRRILVIEGPDVDVILKSLGIDEDEVEDDEDEDEEDPVIKKRNARKNKKQDEDEDLEDDEELGDGKPKQEPKPPTRSRYFGGR